MENRFNFRHNHNKFKKVGFLDNKYTVTFAQLKLDLGI